MRVTFEADSGNSFTDENGFLGPRIQIFELTNEGDPVDLLKDSAPVPRAWLAENDRYDIVARVLPDLEDTEDMGVVSWSIAGSPGGAFDPESFDANSGASSERLLSTFTPNKNPSQKGEHTVTATYTIEDGVDKAQVDVTITLQALVQVVVGENLVSDPLKARQAIAETIRNRVDDSGFPNTFSGVIFEPSQYDSIGDPNFNNAINRDQALASGLLLAYDDSVFAAGQAFDNTLEEVTLGSPSFFAPLTGNSTCDTSSPVITQRTSIEAALASGESTSLCDLTAPVFKPASPAVATCTSPDGVPMRSFTPCQFFFGFEDQVVVVPGVPNTV